MANGESATFFFDTNIESIEGRIQAGLRAIQRDVNKQISEPKLTTNLPRDLARLGSQTASAVSRINKQLSKLGEGETFDLTAAYDRELRLLQTRIARTTGGRGLSVEVGLKFADATFNKAVKELQANLDAAARSQSVSVRSGVGSGVLANTAIDREAFTRNAKDTAYNRAYSQRLRERNDVTDKTLRAQKISARAATDTASADTRTTKAAQSTATSREKTARSATATAASAETESKAAKSSADSATKKATARKREADVALKSAQTVETSATTQQRADAQAATDATVIASNRRRTRTATGKMAANSEAEARQQQNDGTGSTGANRSARGNTSTTRPTRNTPDPASASGPTPSQKPSRDVQPVNVVQLPQAAQRALDGINSNTRAAATHADSTTENRGLGAAAGAAKDARVGGAAAVVVQQLQALAEQLKSGAITQVQHDQAAAGVRAAADSPDLSTPATRAAAKKAAEAVADTAEVTAKAAKKPTRRRSRAEATPDFTPKPFIQLPGEEDPDGTGARRPKTPPPGGGGPAAARLGAQPLGYLPAFRRKLGPQPVTPGFVTKNDVLSDRTLLSATALSHLGDHLGTGVAQELYPNLADLLGGKRRLGVSENPIDVDNIPGVQRPLQRRDPKTGNFGYDPKELEVIQQRVDGELGRLEARIKGFVDETGLAASQAGRIEQSLRDKLLAPGNTVDPTATAKRKDLLNPSQQRELDYLTRLAKDEVSKGNASPADLAEFERARQQTEDNLRTGATREPTEADLRDRELGRKVRRVLPGQRVPGERLAQKSALYGLPQLPEDRAADLGKFAQQARDLASRQPPPGVPYPSQEQIGILNAAHDRVDEGGAPYTEAEKAIKQQIYEANKSAEAITDYNTGIKRATDHLRRQVADDPGLLYRDDFRVAQTSKNKTTAHGTYNEFEAQVGPEDAPVSIGKLTARRDGGFITHVEDVNVPEVLQRKGIGSRLFFEARDRIRAQGTAQTDGIPDPSHPLNDLYHHFTRTEAGDALARRVGGPIGLANGGIADFGATGEVIQRPNSQLPNYLHTTSGGELDRVAEQLRQELTSGLKREVEAVEDTARAEEQAALAAQKNAADLRTLAAKRNQNVLPQQGGLAGGAGGQGSGGGTRGSGKGPGKKGPGSGGGKSGGAGAGSGGRGGNGGTPPPPPGDDEDPAETPDPKKPTGKPKGPRNTPERKTYDMLTGGQGKFEKFIPEVTRLSEQYVALVKDGLTRIFKQTATGFSEIEKSAPAFMRQVQRLQQQRAAAELKAEKDKLTAELVLAQQVASRQSRRNEKNLTKGAAEEGEFAPGVVPIGSAGGNYVADTRELQDRIFKKTKDGFQEIERGTTEFAKQARRLREQEAKQAASSTVFGSFRAGVASTSFGGSGGGGNGVLQGLARSAGVSTKYAVIGSALYSLQGALAGAGQEILDFEDSVTEMNIALSGAAGTDGLKTSTNAINQLADSATLAGANVGEAMDQAASAMRAFSDQTDKTPEGLEALSTRFSAEASKIKTITGGTLKDVSDNLKATALAYGTTDFSKVTDAIAGAKVVGGGNENDIQAGIAASAVAAKEAGFSLNENAVLISRIVAETSESGQLAATRFSKVVAILGGSAGKSALRNLNQNLAPDEQINVKGTIRDQVSQLSKVYPKIDEAQRQQLINSLGGTANTKELIVLLQDANKLIAEADNGFTGKGEKEFQDRLDDIRATLTRISGELKNIVVAFANTSIFDPFFIFLREGVLPALEAVRQILQNFNAIPKPIREAAAFALAIYGTLKLITALRAAGGIGAFFTNVEAKAAPTRALSRQTLRAQKIKQEAEAAGKLGGAGAAATAAPIVLAGADAEATAAARQARLAAKSARLGRLTGAPQRGEYDASGTFIPIGSNLEREAEKNARRGLLNAGADARREALLNPTAPKANPLTRASRAVKQTLQETAASLTGFTSEVRSRRIIDLQEEVRRTGDLGAARRLRSIQGVPADGETAPRGLRRTLDRARFGAGNVYGSLGYGPNALSEADRAGQEAVGGKSGKGFRKVTDALGGGVGIGLFAATTIGTGLYAASQRIGDAVKEFEKLRTLQPDSFGVDDLRATADKMKAGASDLNNASAGLFGTIQNFFQGNATGARSKALTERSTFLNSQADVIETATEKARSGGGTDLASSIDFSSADALQESLKGLDDAGRSATTQFGALLAAMDRMAESGKGATVALTDLQKTQLSSRTGAVVQEKLIAAQTKARQAASIKAVHPNAPGFVTGIQEGLVDTLTGGRFLERQDNRFGRAARFIARNKYIGKTSNQTEAQFQETQLDTNKLAQGVTDITQTFLDQGGRVDSTAGAEGLKQLYIEFYKNNAPNLTPAQIKQKAEEALATVKQGQKDLTSITDKSATLNEILTQGEGLASKAAANNGVQAGLGNRAIDPTGKGQAFTESSDKLANLKVLRERYLELGAPQSAIEDLNDQIAVADLANEGAYQTRQDQRLTERTSKIAPQSVQERNKAAQKAANKRLKDAGYDPETGKRLQKKVRVSRAQSVFNDATGKKETRVVTTDELQDTTAEHPLDPVAAEAAKQAKRDADRAVAQQTVVDAASKRRSNIDPRDELGNSKADTKDAKDQLKFLQEQKVTGSQLDDAKLAVTKAEQAEARETVEHAIAARNVNAIPESDIDTATRALKDAKQRLTTMKKGTDEYNKQLAEVGNAQNQQAIAADAIKSINRQLQIDLTDPVAVACEALQTADDNLKRTIKRNKNADPQTRIEQVGKATIAKRQAEAALESAQFQKFLTAAQTADQLGTISHKAYLSLLQGRADQIQAELASMDQNSNQFQQLTDERNQLLLAIKSGADTLSGVFNIGDIKVPTPYEVRKAIKDKDFGTVLAANSAFSTAGNVTTDNSTQSVVLNGVPIQQVVTMLQNMFGLKVRTTASRRAV